MKPYIKEALTRHITEEEVLRGIEQGLIHIENEYADGGVVCRIWTGWFYFAGQEGEDMTASEWMYCVPIEDTARMIAEVLRELEEDYGSDGEPCEWLMYRFYLDATLKMED